MKSKQEKMLAGEETWIDPPFYCDYGANIILSGKAIEIGDDVWIGGGAILCPGVSVGAVPSSDRGA